jgi:uncharacterized protein YecT (DUF1311 family)
MSKHILLLFLVSATAWAQQPSASIDPCKPDPVSQMQMNLCADYQFKQSDARLNRVYQKAMQNLKGDSGALDSLKQSEVAWLSYRDFQCKAAGRLYAGGSMAPLAVSGCLKTLTDQRIDALKSVYENGDRKLD